MLSTMVTAATTMQGMSLFPDQPPPPSPPAKPKLSAEERRARQADRLRTIRLRMAVGRALDEQGIATPAAFGEALGMPAAEATKLLTRYQWREDDLALLTAAAARLGLTTSAMPEVMGDPDRP
jgi:hypothetical protein